MSTRRGKIALLPLAIREQLNERLLGVEGHAPAQGPELLPWLNSLPEVRAVLASKFDGRDIDADNLSQWRLGGYKDWLQAQKVRNFARIAAAMDEAGQASNILREISAGKLLEALEALDEENPEQLLELADRASKLSSAGTAAKRLNWQARNADKRNEQADRALALKELHAAGKFVEYYEDAKARDLAEAAKTDKSRLPELATYLFGRPDLEELEAAN